MSVMTGWWRVFRLLQPYSIDIAGFLASKGLQP